MRSTRRVAVGERARQVLGQVQVESAAEGCVQLSHAQGNPEQGHSPFDHPANQKTVVLLTPVRHGLHSSMRRLADSLRVHIEAAAENNTIKPIEDSVEFRLLGKRWNYDRHATGGKDTIEVASV